MKIIVDHTSKTCNNNSFWKSVTTLEGNDTIILWNETIQNIPKSDIPKYQNKGTGSLNPQLIFSHVEPEDDIHIFICSSIQLETVLQCPPLIATSVTIHFWSSSTIFLSIIPFISNTTSTIFIKNKRIILTENSLHQEYFTLNHRLCTTIAEQLVGFINYIEYDKSKQHYSLDVANEYNESRSPSYKSDFNNIYNYFLDLHNNIFKCRISGISPYSIKHQFIALSAYYEYLHELHTINHKIKNSLHITVNEDYMKLSYAKDKLKIQNNIETLILHHELWYLFGQFVRI